MKRDLLLFLVLTIIGALLVLPNFLHNKWMAVEPTYYEEWQTRYDRLVIARLVKTRQDGFLSAGGLLGIGDVDYWSSLSSTHRHQYETYLEGGKFESYFVYRSNPGFQGILYGIPDRLMNIDSEQKILIFRAFTALASALVMGLIFSAFVFEFGFLAGILTLLFSAFSIWIVLPAGSIFWNLWASYMPFLAGMYLLANSTQKGGYNARRIYVLLFAATLLKILLSGFDMITASLIMTTVPFVFFSINEEWGWKTFIDRFIRIGLVISGATFTGLVILSAQIIANDGSFTSAINYVESRFGHHAAGNSNFYFDENIEATKISAFEVTEKYLVMPAINVRLPGPDTQILYWQLVVLFALATVVYFVFRKRQEGYPRKAIALIVATWYSLLAPLSWYILFRPHSIIHTHVNTMGWQMPFTLLGFALCGYVVTELLKKKLTNRPT